MLDLKNAEGSYSNLAKGDRPSTSNASGYRSWAEVTAVNIQDILKTKLIKQTYKLK